MSNISFYIDYSKNEGLVLSPSELLERYFFGIPICTRDGRALSMDVVKSKILSAQEITEKMFMIKLNRSVITEDLDFIRSEWNSWGYIKASYPVEDVLLLEGFINTIKQIQYPLEWVSHCKKSDENLFYRTVHLIPAGSSSPTTSSSIIFSGITPHLGFLGLDNIPNYWTVKYATGFHNNIPHDLIDFVGKLASIQILGILGDVLNGVGVSSQSLSFDGLSQSVATVRGGTNSLFAARITQYMNECKEQRKFFENFYKGLAFAAL